MLVAISAVGSDRPGIVSRVSGVLYDFGCNLEETTMTRLRDQFAMLLLVRLPPGSVPAELEQALRGPAELLGLSLIVRPLPATPDGAPEQEGEGYILRVYGADQPGIVHRVTSALAERGLNITDLNTRVIPGSSGPVYVMLLELDAPDSETALGLQSDLERLLAELGVEIGLEALEREAL
jgi:glycine cleavage system transcriptional repressor